MRSSSAWRPSRLSSMMHLAEQPLAPTSRTPCPHGGQTPPAPPPPTSPPARQPTNETEAQQRDEAMKQSSETEQDAQAGPAPPPQPPPQPQPQLAAPANECGVTSRHKDADGAPPHGLDAPETPTRLLHESRSSTSETTPSAHSPYGVPSQSLSVSRTYVDGQDGETSGPALHTPG